MNPPENDSAGCHPRSETLRPGEPPTREPGVIAVFAKPPVRGEAKTRLAAVLGPEAAARLARAFFEDTWRRLGELSGVRRVLASTSGDLTPFGVERAEVWLQGEGDLGERIERVASQALSVAPFFLGVGADSPGLPLGLLEAAQAALVEHDAVLGPAEDGGYYLIGLKRVEPSLFSELPWSAPDTCAATRGRLEGRGFSLAMLPGWFDVDELPDLHRLRAAIAAGAVDAPSTASVLASLQLP